MFSIVIRLSIILCFIFPSCVLAVTPLNITTGWNLVGNSTESKIDVASTFSDTSKIISVWTWNKTSSKWSFYTPSMAADYLSIYASNKGYDVLTSIDPKSGFWVNASAEVVFDGPVANGLTLIESDLQPGWNLVSSADNKTPSQLNQNLCRDMSAAGKNIVTAWAWDVHSKIWKFYATYMDAQGGTVLAEYISSKGYLPFRTAISASDGFWMNIGIVAPDSINCANAAPLFDGMVSGTASDMTTIKLAWSDAKDDTTSPSQIKYNIYVSTDPKFTLNDATLNQVVIGTKQTVITGLTAGTTYYVQVVAIDQHGLMSTVADTPHSVTTLTKSTDEQFPEQMSPTEVQNLLDTLPMVDAIAPSNLDSFSGASVTGQSEGQRSLQREYYPIIFIHGYGGEAGGGGEKDVEGTWNYMTERLNNINGFSYYGKIWENTQLPSNLSKKSIFSFNFYRSDNNELMGTTKGKIGAIPISESEIPSMYDSQFDVKITFCCPPSFSWTSGLVDFKNTYFFDNRVSYAERLKVTIDNVIQATHAKKVIIVTHSMGGLVARAYIRWLGGEKKVFKLLTVATPNHGIVDDGRAASLKLMNTSKWQDGGEYLEMSARKNFNNRSYTEWLNDGWEKYCSDNGVRYATVAGNNNPWYPFFSVGNNSDGVIDRDSVLLNGAEFNALSKTSHIGKFIGDLPDEINILKSTNTLEIIKRWVFEDRVHIAKQLQADPPFGPNPFGENVYFGYKLNGYAVNAVVSIYDIAGRRVYLGGIPLYPGSLSYLIDNSGLSYGVYPAFVKAYDMNGEILNIKFKLAKANSKRFLQPMIWFDSIPDKTVPYDFRIFTMKSDYPISKLRYRLNNDDWTNWQTSSSINLINLPDGMNTIYVQSISNNGDASYIATYSWIENEFGFHISTINLPDGYVGTSYNKSLGATGGVQPYTWSVSGLPTGLSLDASTGIVSGIPTADKSGEIIVTTTDTNGSTATEKLTINVYAVPKIATVELEDAYVNSAYNQSLSVTGGKSPYAWSIIAGGLPLGLSLNASTGSISGTPTTVEDSVFTVQVEDTNNKVISKIFRMTAYPTLVHYGWDSQCQGGQVKSNIFDLGNRYNKLDLIYNTGSLDNTSFIAEAYNSDGQWVEIDKNDSYNGNHVKNDISVSGGYSKIKVTHYNSRNYCTNNNIFSGCMNWLYNSTYFEITPKQECQTPINVLKEDISINWHVGWGTQDNTIWINCPDRNIGGWGCFNQADLTIPMTAPSFVSQLTMVNGNQWNTVTGIVVYAIDGENEEQIWSGKIGHDSVIITLPHPVKADKLKLILNDSIYRSTLTVNGVFAVGSAFMRPCLP